MKELKFTRKECEEQINRIGCSASSLIRNGGRIPNRMKHKYGTWLRRNDPIVFELYLHEERRKKSGRI